MVIRRHLLIWAAGAMLLASATLARAQEEDPADIPYTGPAGIPGTPAGPAEDDGSVVVFQEEVMELTVTPPNATGGSYSASSTIPGDVILLADPAGGDALSNWVAVAQFFNPSDPTGAQGLLATEEEGFFARDFAGGFADFSLLPNVYYGQNGGGSSGTDMVAVTTYEQFGPVGAIPAGQSGITILTIDGNIPEPGAASMVALGAAVLIVAARCRRRFKLQPAEAI
jgi:hypothetical protein